MFEYYEEEILDRKLLTKMTELSKLSKYRRSSLSSIGQHFETEVRVYVCRVSLIQCQPSAHPPNVTRRM